MTCGAHSWLHSWGIFERIRLEQCWIPVKNKLNSKEPKSVPLACYGGGQSGCADWWKLSPGKPRAEASSECSAQRALISSLLGQIQAVTLLCTWANERLVWLPCALLADAHSGQG